MKFVMLGAGALGSIIGGHLIHAGEEVTMLARGARAAYLRKHGITVQGLVDFNVRCDVETDPAGLREADVLIDTVKTYQNMAAIEPLKHLAVGNVFSLQNGVLKNQQLADVFGEAAVLGAIGMLSGELLADGVVRFTVNQNVETGALSGGACPRSEDIVAALNNAGINASVSPSIQSSEWSKYVGWSGVMALSVLTRLVTYKFLLDPDAARIAARVMRETAAVADALGIVLEDWPPMPAAQIAQGSEDEAVACLQEAGRIFEENAPQHRVSTLQDLERGQRLEIEETLGHTIAEAKRLGVAVPTVEMCYRLVSSIDRSLIV
jgi:2-dehydropantoate 2-reductase